MKKKLLLLLLLPLILFSCQEDEDSNQNIDTNNLELIIDNYTYDGEWISSKLNWNMLDDNVVYKYFLYYGHISTEGRNAYSNGNGIPELVHFSNLNYPYTIKVVAYNNDGGTTTNEFRITTPSIQDFEGMPEVDVSASYIGYSAINFNIEGLDYSFQNKIYLTNGYDVRELFAENYHEQTLLVNNLPIFYYLGVEKGASYMYGIEVDVYNDNNDILLIRKYKFSTYTKTVYKLPDDDLVMEVFNIQDNSVNVTAYNNTDITTYDPTSNGNVAENFKVYLNNNLLGTYQCYFDGSFGSASFPLIDGLDPNTIYTIKIEVDYNNDLVNTDYEDDFNMTTFKESEFTTYQDPLVSNLDVNIDNIYSNGFDFRWRTDLSNLYNCSIYDYDYEFILEIDGVNVMTFDSSQTTINVENLNSNTTYSVKLICNFYLGYGNVIETRVNEFDITTL